MGEPNDTSPPGDDAADAPPPPPQRTRGGGSSTAPWPPAPPALSQQPATAEIAAPVLPPRGSDPSFAGPGATRHADAQPWGVPDGFQPAVLGRSKVAEAPEPVPLRPSGWVRAGYIVAVLVCGPALIFAASMAFSDDDDTRLAGFGLMVIASGLLLVAVISWTWVNVDNSRRLLAHSLHRAPVSPLRAAVWWMIIPLIGLPLFAGVFFLVDQYADGPSRNEGDADVLRAFLLLGWFVIVLALWSRPYQYLGSVMRRIHGDSGQFLRWVWVPVSSMILATVAIVSFASVTGRNPDNSAVLTNLIVLLSVIPYLLWSWFGWKAMTDMDDLLRGRSARQRVQRDLYLQTVHRTDPPPLN